VVSARESKPPAQPSTLHIGRERRWDEQLQHTTRECLFVHVWHSVLYVGLVGFTIDKLQAVVKVTISSI
jgi:hypothetical protein